jgi:hypothetical protein
MSNDIYHQETYTHKCGKKYHVALYYDYDMGPPQEEGDGYGVTERLDWNPTDEEQLEQHLLDEEPELEEETRLRLMRQLSRPSNRYDSGLYYDVLSSLHKARADGWGANPDWKAANPNATKEEELMYVVNKDFKYLKGWYDDDWHYLTLGVAPIDEDGKVLEHDREYCGGYETLMLEDPEQRACVVEAIEDRIWEIDRLQKSRLHKNQMELCFA